MLLLPVPETGSGAIGGVFPPCFADFSALFFVALVIVHIYFGVRPEKLWMTRGMILGWITRKEYEAHYDSKKWVDVEHSNP